MQSVIETLGQRAARHPQRVALLRGDQRVSYGELWSRVVAAASYLSDCGVRPGERVLLAAPSVPAFVYGYFATHLLGAVAVTFDPLALASHLGELIRRTQPVLAFGIDAQAHSTAPCPSRTIEELEWLSARQRDFSFPPLDSLADLIFTAGTTGRPKGVPLTHRNLAAAASQINAVIGTSEGDVEVVPIPLYHSFGLGRLRCGFSAGATIVLVQGFHLPGEVFAALERHTATGLVGVPAGFAFLMRPGERGLGPFADRLRYIEIGSAPMPLKHKRTLMELLPRTSVFMHYGLTEASRSAFIEFHRDSAHLETVGRSTPGVRIEVRDESGKACGLGERGVLWISGPHVSSSYWDDAELSAASFADGWLNTGDQGMLGEDGYLTITGRLKEIINRGGQKISPKEVDDVLMDHPDVVSAATFPIPHPTLGEEIGSALVIKRGVVLTEQALTHFLASRLAEYKVPRQFVFVDDIPKGSTGKIQRHNLAAALGLSNAVESERAGNHPDDRPSTPLEAKLQALWRKMLRLDQIGLHQNFFLLGGDSLLALELLILVEQELGVRLPQSVFVECGTVAGMAAYIEKDEFAPCVVPMQPKGNLPPFFCVHGVVGGIFGFLQLVRHLGSDQPFYGIQSVGLDGKQMPLKRIEDMAAHYLREIRKYQPVGPYYLGGYSMGGVVAYEMTRQLRAEGEDVALLALIDTYSGVGRQFILGPWLRFHWRKFAKVPFSETGSYLAQRLRNVTWRVLESIRRRLSATREYLPARGGRGNPEGLHQLSLEEANEMAVRAYAIAPCECDAVLLKGELRAWDHPDVHDGWRALVRGDLEIRTISGGHWDIITEPHVRTLGAELADCLERRHARRSAQTGQSSSKAVS